VSFKLYFFTIGVFYLAIFGLSYTTRNGIGRIFLMFVSLCLALLSFALCYLDYCNPLLIPPLVLPLTLLLVLIGFRE